MQCPEFFEETPTITLRDPLALFLGACCDGLITYEYRDVLKLAGHSCPTVAGAYLMVRRGLLALYGDEIPERGNIEVLIREDREEGTTGVVASIATLITGATVETGFAGIGNPLQFRRRNLMKYNQPINGMMALRRMDTGKTVELDLHAEAVAPGEGLFELFPCVLSGNCTEEERQQFGVMWQDRVRRMLVNHADDDNLVTVRELTKVYAH